MYRRLFGIDKKKKNGQVDPETVRLFFWRGGGRSLALREGWDADAVNQYSGRKGGDAEYYHSGRGGRWLLLRRKGWEVVVVANAAD